MALLLLVGGASAIVAGQEIVVEIPFDFRAGGGPLPPGAYAIAIPEESAGSLTIRSASPSRLVAVAIRKSAGTGHPAASTISFRAYGDSRFLSAIEIEGAGRWDVVPAADETALTHASEPPKVMSLRAAAPKKP